MDEDVNNEPKLQEESKVEEAQPKAEEPPPPCEERPVEKEPVKKDEPTTIKADKEKTNEEEVAVVTNKFRSAVVIDENRKERVNIVFIGHVDAGKSTIGGQIMYLTGMVDKRTLEKYEKEAKEKGRESWYLSWALDTNEEEREKENC
uniref:Tr-type G domain-containing protein n=1 Tax=Ditylenchus dipsaci TaxID=166011 RepID=A0A915EQG3_9BILA